MCAAKDFGSGSPEEKIIEDASESKFVDRTQDSILIHDIKMLKRLRGAIVMLWGKVFSDPAAGDGSGTLIRPVYGGGPRSRGPSRC